MPRPKIQVLLALRDTAHFAPIVQALLYQDAALSMVPLQSVEALLERLRTETPSLLVLELEQDAAFLEQVRAQHPDLPVVVVLERPTAQLAFAASRLGAEDVLALPLDEAQTAERMQSVLEKFAAQPETSPLPASAQPTPARPPSASRPVPVATPAHASSGRKGGHAPQLIGSNPRMAEVRDIIDKVAATNATVLVRGESGVGKEIVARMIYSASHRAQRPFVKLNCAAIPNDLLESELFGYEAGAFTGAMRQKPGKFEMADTGTLFLDEIGEMHPLLQAKLLHVLQDGQFSRLGAKHDISVDVRVICATNKLLEQRVAEGLFREDLFYRINVVTVHIPPLRERRDEIPLLTRFFLEKYAAEYHRPLRLFSPEVEQQMLSYRWPGNIRELENLCKRFVIVGGETQILRELSQRRPLAANSVQLPASEADRWTATPTEILPSDTVILDGKHASGKALTQPAEAGPGPSLLEIGRRAAWQAERQAIQEMLLLTHWNRREAAARLRVSYKALLNKMKQIEREEEAEQSTREDTSAE
jgi:DNA-binding NtrC family response regulator